MSALALICGLGSTAATAAPISTAPAADAPLTEVPGPEDRGPENEPGSPLPDPSPPAVELPAEPTRPEHPSDHSEDPAGTAESSPDTDVPVDDPSSGDVAADSDEISADNVAVPANAGITIAGGLNQVAADVLGRGYEQVVRLNGHLAEITEPLTRGGAVIRSFDVGTARDWPRSEWGVPFYHGGYQMADIVKHAPSRLAVLDGHIYVSAPLVDFSKATDQGSVIRKYTAEGFLVKDATRTFPKDYIVTALDAVRHQNKPFLAIGLNKGGVRVAHADRPGLPDFREVHTGWDRGGFARDMVTAVKLYTADDGRHRLMLATGRFVYDDDAIVTVDLDFQRGSVKDAGIEMWRNNKRPAGIHGPWEWPDVLEAGPFGPSKRMQVGISWPTSRRTTFVDGIHGANFTSNDAQETTALRFFKDASGEPRVAIHRGDSSVIAGVNASGQLYYTHWNLTNKTIPFAVPGYRAWSVTYENRTRSDARITAFTGDSRADGCWYGSDFDAAERPLPSDRITVRAGTSSETYGTAQRLTDDSAARGLKCGGDNKGVFYLQIDPNSSIASREIVQLHGDKDGIVVEDQTGGGAVQVTTERHGLHGVRIVIAERFAEPKVTTAPKLSAKRLTPTSQLPGNDSGHPDDPRRPVFRFSVTGAVWDVPGAESDLADITLPNPVAEASPDGVTWTELGTTTSPVAPTRKGAAITFGGATFDWQNAYGGAYYRYFRVALPGGVVSEVIDTGDTAAVPAPEPTTLVLGLSSVGAPAPRPSGLDQSALRVSLKNSSSQGMDPVKYADLYDRIYARDEKTEALITGLNDPKDPGQLILLSRERGQYANDELNADAAAITIYLSTTLRNQDRGFKLRFKADGKTIDTHKSTNVIVPRPAIETLRSNGIGLIGIEIGPCIEGTCRLTAPTLDIPAMHSLTAKTVSLQLRSVAVPGEVSLPLLDRNEPAENIHLYSAVMDYRPHKAIVPDGGRFGYLATVSTGLVTHGHLIAAENHWVRAREQP